MKKKYSMFCGNGIILYIAIFLNAIVFDFKEQAHSQRMHVNVLIAWYRMDGFKRNKMQHAVINCKEILIQRVNELSYFPSS